MSIILIRHAPVPGNLRHAYIGCRTDESICENAPQEIAKRRYPIAERVFVSPLKRCTETAALIYPHIRPIIVDDFRECDFGAFEGLNYEQLNGRSDYQAWIDSGGELPFPGGESRREFAERCVRAFRKLDYSGDTAIVAHGGTIMAIMEALAVPQGSYFDYQVKNLEGFILSRDGTYTKSTFEIL